MTAEAAREIAAGRDDTGTCPYGSCDAVQIEPIHKIAAAKLLDKPTGVK